MTELVIFDLDGTLLNTIDDLAASTNYALRQNGYPEHDLAEYPYFVGNGISKLVERALPESERSGETIDRVKQVFLYYYQHHSSDLTRPYEGIPELLARLQQQGIALAVASNKYQRGTEVLAEIYFPGIFSTVLGQREGIPVKPNPCIVHDILQQTGKSAANTLYVGDSGVDMQTAANSGIRSVGVTWGFRTEKELKSNGACHIVHAPLEILQLTCSLDSGTLSFPSR